MKRDRARRYGSDLERPQGVDMCYQRKLRSKDYFCGARPVGRCQGNAGTESVRTKGKLRGNSKDSEVARSNAQKVE
jgi:hypothetical protein